MEVQQLEMRLDPVPVVSWGSGISSLKHSGFLDCAATLAALPGQSEGLVCKKCVPRSIFFCAGLSTSILMGAW